MTIPTFQTRCQDLVTILCALLYRIAEIEYHTFEATKRAYNPRLLVPPSSRFGGNNMSYYAGITQCKCNNHDCNHNVYHPQGSSLQTFCERCTPKLGTLKLCFSGHVTNPDGTLSCRVCSGGSSASWTLPLPSMMLSQQPPVPTQSHSSAPRIIPVRDDNHCKNAHCKTYLYDADKTSNTTGMCQDCFTGHGLKRKYVQSAGSTTTVNTCGICDASAPVDHPGICNRHWSPEWRWE